MKSKIIVELMLALVSLSAIYCGSDNIVLKTEHIAALKQIRFYKWKTSNLKVDTIKVNPVFDDKLTGFYSGHVDLGIDFDHHFTNHIEGDSVVYIETQLDILNTDKWFIEEFQYMETGTFTSAERKALDETANRKIFEKCLSEGTIDMAIANLNTQITDILINKFHFKNVVIKCKNNAKL